MVIMPSSKRVGLRLLRLTLAMTRGAQGARYLCDSTSSPVMTDDQLIDLRVECLHREVTGRELSSPELSAQTWIHGCGFCGKEEYLDGAATPLQTLEATAPPGDDAARIAFSGEPSQAKGPAVPTARRSMPTVIPFGASQAPPCPRVLTQEMRVFRSGSHQTISSLRSS